MRPSHPRCGQSLADAPSRRYVLRRPTSRRRRNSGAASVRVQSGAAGRNMWNVELVNDDQIIPPDRISMRSPIDWRCIEDHHKVFAG